MTYGEKGCPAHPVGYPATWLPALLLAAAAILLPAACGSGRDPEHREPPDPPTGAGVLVLRISLDPGFTGPADTGRVPEFSLYGDGRAIVSDRRRGALWTAREYYLTRAAYRRIYRDAYAAGLDQPRNIDQPAAVDAPTLTLVLLASGRPRTTTVTRPEHRDPQRHQIAAFQHHLQPASWRPADLVFGPTGYRPTRLAVIATWSTTAAAAPRSPSWPLQPLAAGTPLHGGLCTLYQGDLLTRAEQIAIHSTPATRWISGANAFYLAFRPLLPDETDCTSLSH
jgi:hypothetical protein